ncbi:Ion transport domain-containing protein [Plasmodiophora brassicae]
MLPERAGNGTSVPVAIGPSSVQADSGDVELDSFGLGVAAFALKSIQRRPLQSQQTAKLGGRSPPVSATTLTAQHSLTDIRKVVCALNFLDEMGIWDFLATFAPPSERATEVASAASHNEASPHRRHCRTASALSAAGKLISSSTPTPMGAGSPVPANSNMLFKALYQARLYERAQRRRIRNADFSCLDLKSVFTQQWMSSEKEACNAQFRMFFDKFQTSVRNSSNANLLATVCQGTTPNRDEQQKYQRMCTFLFRRPDAMMRSYGADVCLLLSQTANTIMLMRDLEVQPNSAVGEGFLNKIDNLLAVMLYRRPSLMTGNHHRRKSQKLNAYAGITLPHIIPHPGTRQPLPTPTSISITATIYVLTVVVVLVALAGIGGLSFSCSDAFFKSLQGTSQVSTNAMQRVAREAVAGAIIDQQIAAQTTSALLAGYGDALAASMLTSQASTFPNAARTMAFEDGRYLFAGDSDWSTGQVAARMDGTALLMGCLLNATSSGPTRAIWSPSIIAVIPNGRSEASEYGISVASPWKSVQNYSNASRMTGCVRVDVPLSLVSSSLLAASDNRRTGDVMLIQKSTGVVLAATQPQWTSAALQGSLIYNSDTMKLGQYTHAPVVFSRSAMGDLVYVAHDRSSISQVAPDWYIYGLFAAGVLFCAVFATSVYRVVSQRNAPRWVRNNRYRRWALVGLVCATILVWLTWTGYTSSSDGRQIDLVMFTIAQGVAGTVQTILRKQKQAASLIRSASFSLSSTVNVDHLLNNVVMPAWGSWAISSVYFRLPDRSVRGMTADGSTLVSETGTCVEKLSGSAVVDVFCNTVLDPFNNAVLMDGRPGLSYRSQLPSSSNATDVTIETDIGIIQSGLTQLASMTSADASVFILERNTAYDDVRYGLVAASNSKEVLSDATQSSDPRVRSLATLLVANPRSLPANGNGEIARDQTQPMTWCSTLQAARNGNDWLAVAMVPRMTLVGDVDDAHTRTLSGVVIIVTLLFSMNWIIGKAYSWLTDALNVERKQSRSQVNLLQSIRQAKLNKPGKFTQLDAFKTAIEPIIQDARSSSWLRDESASRHRLNQPIDSTEFRYHAWSRACRHIQDSNNGLNVLHICLLENHRSGMPLRIYRLIQNSIVKQVLAIVIVFHLALTFAKPVSSDAMLTQGVALSVQIIEGVCLLSEFLFILARLLTKYTWVRAWRSTADPVIRESALKEALPTRLQLGDVILVLTYSVILIDWIVIVSSNRSIEYFFPLRPLLYLFVNSQCQEGLKLFARTLMDALKVFVLYLYVIVAISCLFLVLFRLVINIDVLSSSFDNIVRSLTACFIFLTGTNNFSEVFYPATAVDPLYAVLFLFVFLVGNHFVWGLTIGTLTSSFEQQKLRHHSYKSVYSRSGILAAFILLDFDEDNQLAVSDVRHFLQFARTGLSVEQADGVIDEIRQPTTMSTPVRKSTLTTDPMTGSRNGVSRGSVTVRPASAPTSAGRTSTVVNVSVPHPEPADIRQSDVSARQSAVLTPSFGVAKHDTGMHRGGSLTPGGLLGPSGISPPFRRSVVVNKRDAANASPAIQRLPPVVGSTVNHPARMSLATELGLPRSSMSVIPEAVAQTVPDVPPNLLAMARGRKSRPSVGGSVVGKVGKSSGTGLLDPSPHVEPGLDYFSLDEFVRCVEKAFLLDVKQSSPVSQQYGWLLALRVLFFDTQAYHDVVKAFTILLISIVSLYGVVEQPAMVDMLCIAMLLFSVIEVSLKIWAYTAAVYWNYSSYNTGPDVDEIQFSHRIEAAVIAISLVGTFICQCMSGFTFTYGQHQDIFRLYLVLPTVRIFTSTKFARHMLFVFVRVIPEFRELVIILLLVIYVYAVIGVLILQGQFDLLPADVRPAIDFDNMFRSALSLLQMLVKDNWHTLMYASIIAKGWNAAWFFISYMIIVNNLFTDLMLSVIIGKFSMVLYHASATQSDVKTAIFQQRRLSLVTSS